MNLEIELPDYDPHRLERQIAILKEMHRRGWYTDDQLQQAIDNLREKDDEQRARFIEAGYRNFDIPKLEREFHEAMNREEHDKLSQTQRWLYPWNLEPPENMFDLICWNPDPEIEQSKLRKQASSDAAPVQHCVARKVDWLWPGRLPLGKLSLLTGDASEGKSLIACDLVARVTNGSHWPDGSDGREPADVLLIAPHGRLSDVVLPRLEAAGADLSRVHVLSRVNWNDPKSGESHGDSFRLPVDGPILERTLQALPSLRLLVIDPLSDFLKLPAAPAERDVALHDVLGDLQALAQCRQFAVLCIDTARRGGIIGTAAGRQWRAHYDATFMTVWGVARDPRDRERRLFLPVRHELGDDRTGFQLTIEPCGLGTARIAWGQPEIAITYPEATGRVRLGRGIWSFSQTADAEAWLREYLKGGEKPSVQIFSDAREIGFTEFPLRSALRRVATKNKQGNGGAWSWRLRENS